MQENLQSMSMNHLYNITNHLLRSQSKIMLLSDGQTGNLREYKVFRTS